MKCEEENKLKNYVKYVPIKELGQSIMYTLAEFVFVPSRLKGTTDGNRIEKASGKMKTLTEGLISRALELEEQVIRLRKDNMELRERITQIEEDTMIIKNAQDKIEMTGQSSTVNTLKTERTGMGDCGEPIPEKIVDGKIDLDELMALKMDKFVSSIVEKIQSIIRSEVHNCVKAVQAAEMRPVQTYAEKVLVNNNKSKNERKSGQRLPDSSLSLDDKEKRSLSPGLVSGGRGISSFHSSKGVVSVLFPLPQVFLWVEEM